MYEMLELILCNLKSGKISDNWVFHCFLTITDFDKISGNLRYSSVTDAIFICQGKWATGVKQFRGFLTCSKQTKTVLNVPTTQI